MDAIASTKSLYQLHDRLLLSAGYLSCVGLSSAREAEEQSTI
jgi:hypothetical protein